MIAVMVAWFYLLTGVLLGLIEFRPRRMPRDHQTQTFIDHHGAWSVFLLIVFCWPLALITRNRK